MEYDLHNNVNDVKAMNHQEITTDTTTAGIIIDTKGYESIEFLILSAVITDGVFTVLLEDGDDSGLSDNAAVATELTLGALPSFDLDDDNVLKRVGCIAKKRYVRLSLVSTGTTLGGFLNSVAIQGHPHSMPVAQ